MGNLTKGIAFFFILSTLVAVMFQVNISSNFAEGLKRDVFEKWVFPTGETVYSVVASNSFVYLTSGDSEGYPSTLYCLDAGTGNQVWNYSAAYIYFTVANGQVYIRASILNNPIAGGFLLCLDASSGAELWKNDLNGHVSELVVVGDRIYAIASSTVYALDTTTGEKEWEYSVPTDTVFRSIFVGEGYVCAVSFTDNEETDSCSSNVYTFKASSGQKIWSQNLGYNTPTRYPTLLSITNGKVFVSQNVTPMNKTGSSTILSLDAQNGTILWKYTTLGVVSDFTVVDGTVYSATSSGGVFAVKASNGSEIWNYKYDSQFGSVIVVDRYLYVSSTKGVDCFNTVDWGRIWSYQASDYNAKPNGNSGVEDLSPTNPIYADGIIYFGWNGPQGWLDTTEHNFYALNAYTGTVVWKNTLSYSIRAAPTIANHTLYIGCSGVTTISPTWIGAGVVIALDLSIISEASPSESISALTLVSVSFVIATTVLVVLFIIHKRKSKITKKV